MKSTNSIDQQTDNTNSKDIISQDFESNQSLEKNIATDTSENKSKEEFNDTSAYIDESDDDTIEEGEEIITSAMPPTQIVNTIVTTTTNPDGSLKRTTKKTTRTVLTTARIRKVKLKNLSTNSESNQSSSYSKNHPEMSNIINFTKYNSEKSDGNSLAQATLAIIPPQTEVIYQENVKPISDIDPDTMAQLKQFPDSVTSQQALTKTTMKKTVSATAATATFYATGSEVMNPNIFTSNESASEVTSEISNNIKRLKDCHQSFSLSSINEKNKTTFNESNRQDAYENETISTENNNTSMKKNDCEFARTITTRTVTTTHSSGSATTTTTTTTTTMDNNNNNNNTRKQTTRVTNNFASKRFFFTFKKPFSLFSKDFRTAIENGQANQNTSLNKTDIVDTEQLALMTMKESERMFSEAKSMFASNQTLTSDKVSQSHSSKSNNEINIYSRNDDGIVQGYQSRFANLPLYQGYGIIAHQIALSNKANTAKKSTPETQNINNDDGDDDGNDQQTSINLVSDPIDIGQISDQSGTDINLVANAFAHLLDESILKFLYEATSQQLVRSGSLNLFDLPAYISGLPQTKELSLSDSTDEGTAHQENEIYDSSSNLSDYHDDKNEELFKQKQRISNLREIQGNKSVTEGVGQKTSRFGVGAQGAFRVAWSEMPEVVESNCLQRLTRHEIQLQEAMFEVITSEASYYQSLNVLVNHFYHAPEFECEPLHSPVQGNQVNNKTGKDYYSPLNYTTGQQDVINTNDQVLSEPSTPSVNTTPIGPTTAYSTNTIPNNNADFTEFCSDLNNANNQTTTRRPLLKPLEKHHLFSNVLLVCLASEMFLRDLEARWESRMPILNEVCDLIVKHAGGVNFEPYITYLRNQTYQMATLRNLCQRENFRSALDNLHAHPISGKNTINSFLALPMQRLTRLKLLVEVIRRLQDAVVRDSKDKTLEKHPFRVPSVRERENVQLALRELNRLLTASETEKELMDRKSRLLTLSSSLEFPDNVKRIAISDKRLIKEGELRECLSENGRMSVLQKLTIRKPNTFYLILFNDMLLITKKKKNERFLVLDYCDRASVQPLVQRSGDPFNSGTNLLKNPKNSISAEPLCHIDHSNDDLKVVPQKFKRLLSPEFEDDVNNIKSKTKTKRHRHFKTTVDFKNLSDSNNNDNKDETNIILSHSETSESNKECSSLNDNNHMNNLANISTHDTNTTTKAANSLIANSLNTSKTTKLSRSGSSLSGYQLRFNQEKNRHLKSSIFNTSQPSTPVSCKTNIIHLKLLGSHNGTCIELTLSTNDNKEFESWCKAFSV
ncbi:unnamed protein product [Schistosoma bovis]|nr:unnamed protein product [Schistosoma bovis]